PSEYDPFFLKTCTDCWKDPLLKGIQRKFIETGIIKQCETGRPCSTRELNQLSKAELPLLPLSRQHMDAVEWLKIPHAYIASEVHQTKRGVSCIFCMQPGSQPYRSSHGIAPGCFTGRSERSYCSYLLWVWFFFFFLLLVSIFWEQSEVILVSQTG
uniref:Uncharacterized protein n=1 Tax=Buteo japonicus TaxID=224669 RepID=A0A8C0BIB5_9AVES